jgi:hypothetical protein
MKNGSLGTVEWIEGGVLQVKLVGPRIRAWRSTPKISADVRSVAMATALLAVWLYVLPLSQIASQRIERHQLEASIEDLTKRGADRSQHVRTDETVDAYSSIWSPAASANRAVMCT